MLGELCLKLEAETELQAISFSRSGAEKRAPVASRRPKEEVLNGSELELDACANLGSERQPHGRTKAWAVQGDRLQEKA